ncbi:MAG: dienelactone hydrolase family protein [Dehalococcoidia bacterium]|nr:dienelactone hydrolase family protein [Dehalococcoidia bacterium]
MKEESLMFPCGGISLEGVLGLPEGKGPFPAVVVCHPHPLYGGSMDNNVVYAVCAGLGRSSIAWLRFNFRGVGRSEGHHANGIGEQDDVKAALTFLSTLREIDPARLAICGYSFGTMVGIPVADSDERVQAMAAISPFFVSPGLLKNYTKPKLFVYGTEDSFVSHQEIEHIVSQLPEPKTCTVVPGADHFWRFSERAVEIKVGDFFASFLTHR